MIGYERWQISISVLQIKEDGKHLTHTREKCHVSLFYLVEWLISFSTAKTYKLVEWSIYFDWGFHLCLYSFVFIKARIWIFASSTPLSFKFQGRTGQFSEILKNLDKERTLVEKARERAFQMRRFAVSGINYSSGMKIWNFPLLLDAVMQPHLLTSFYICINVYRFCMYLYRFKNSQKFLNTFPKQNAFKIKFQVKSELYVEPSNRVYLFTIET